MVKDFKNVDREAASMHSILAMPSPLQNPLKIQEKVNTGSFSDRPA